MLICDEAIDAQMASTRLRAQQTAVPVVARSLPLGIRARVPRDQCRRVGDAGGRPLRPTSTRGKLWTGHPESSTL